MSVESSALNVERSAPRGAVFLSYASQDAEAAKRICEALHAVGVEVWFDQSELVGGDAWDQKIRKQIGSCALFVPIISASTQARAEGYFRLEWKLADRRMDLIGKSKAFLLPVCIDDTKDSEADVPDSFLSVQWTRLKGGGASPAFCARVQKLLAGGPGPGSERPGVSIPREIGPARGVSQTSRNRWTVMAGCVVVAVASAVYFSRHPAPNARSGSAEPRPPVAAPATPSAARRMALQAVNLTNSANRDSQTMASATEMAAKAIELDSLDGEVWAYAAQVDINARVLGFDRSDARVTQIRTKVARAKSLAPQSPVVRIVEAIVLTELDSRIPGRLAEAERILRKLEYENLDDPTPATVAANLGKVLWALGRYEEAARLQERAGWLNSASWSFFDAGNIPEALRVAERQRRLDPDGGWLQVAVVHLYAGDLAASKAALDQMSDEARRTERAIQYYATLAYLERDWEGTIAAVNQLAGDFYEAWDFRGPKRLFTGCAHYYAGREEAARIEWQAALRVVDQRLAAEGNSGDLLFHQWELLTRLGRSAEAVQAARLMQQLGFMNSGEEPTMFFALQQDREGVLRTARRRIVSPRGMDRIALALLRYRPELDFIRDDPRWQKLLREALLPGMKPFADQPAAGSNQQSASDPKPSTSNLAPDSKSVAVLAFANLSDDKGNEYFSDGISEELLNVLAKIPGLKVTARTSAFFFKGKQVPLAEIAQQLGVAYVVEGSVRKAGDRVRITAQLIKAADGFNVWSDKFDRDLKDVFAVQDEIAGLIAQNLRLTMGANSPGAKAAINPEAFELYVQARQAWNLRTPKGFDRAEELLNRALSLEPEFARAHAALSDVWVARGMTLGEMGQFGQRESLVMQRIIATAERAVALDPNSAEAHASLGSAYTSVWRLADATRTLRHAVELNPNYATGRQMLGRALLAQGFFAEGAAELARAAELDPLSHRIIDNNAIALVAMGRPRGALAAAERALALMPDSVQAAIWRARSLSNLGRHEEAVAQARRVQDDGGIQSAYLVEVFTAAGLKSEAEGILATVDRKFPAWKFIGLVALGRLDEALAAMNPADMMPQFFYQANLDAVRDDPRFQQLLATLGLTEANARIQAWRAAHPSEIPEAKP